MSVSPPSLLSKRDGGEYTMTRKERFMSKVEFTTEAGCWVWKGSKSGSGYGQFWNGEKCIPAHWYLLDDEQRAQLSEAGREACHHCDNRLCVRPSHIFIGTHSDNMQDMIAKGRHNPAAKSASCRRMLQTRRLLRGEKNHQSILTDSDVSTIKAIAKRRGLGAAIARHFKVSETVVSGIWNGKRWAHVTPDATAAQRAEAFLRAISKWEKS